MDLEVLSLNLLLLISSSFTKAQTLSIHLASQELEINNLLNTTQHKFPKPIVLFISLILCLIFQPIQLDTFILVLRSGIKVICKPIKLALEIVLIAQILLHLDLGALQITTLITTLALEQEKLTL